jgi:hypothetical protein
MSQKNTSCNDCGVEPGERHKDGCDIARCASTGFQHLQCEGELHNFNGRVYGEHEGECVPGVWRGDYPGDLECREWHLWTRHIPESEPYWQPCSKDDDGATEDLNTLYLWAADGRIIWNREEERWIMP